MFVIYEMISLSFLRRGNFFLLKSISYVNIDTYVHVKLVFTVLVLVYWLENKYIYRWKKQIIASHFPLGLNTLEKLDRRRYLVNLK